MIRPEQLLRDSRVRSWWGMLLLCGFLSSISVAEEEIPEVSIAELEELIESGGPILLDANGSKYFAKGHIPGAIDFRANETSLEKALGPDRDRLIIVYCGSPACDAYLAVAEAVKKLGYPNVKHLPDGISGWIAAGKPTDRLGK